MSLNGEETKQITGERPMMSSRVGQRWIFRTNSGWLGGDRITDLSVLTLCSALVLMGLVMLLKVGAERMRTDAATEWPTTFGTVLSAQLEELEYGSELRWFPRVTYQYTVQGRTVVTTRLSPGQQPHWRDRADAIRFLERYLLRSRVVVYYNPTNAADSVLEPRGGGRSDHALGLGVALVALGLWCLMIYDWLR
jgi:hypothetical protein